MQISLGHIAHARSGDKGSSSNVGLMFYSVEVYEWAKTYVTEETDLNLWIPKRPANSHKGTYGHVLVIAGSRGKEGAAGLTALAALRTGCGLVTLAIPESCRRSVEFQPLEVMTVTAPETDAGSFALSSKEILLRHCKEKSAVACDSMLELDIFVLS